MTKKASAPITERSRGTGPWIGALVAFAALAAGAQADVGDDAATDTLFARVDVTEDRQPRALQMAIVSYATGDRGRNPRVDLIGAVHVGDRGYYAELNARFRDYDAVLYELVAPEDAAIPQPGSDRQSLVSGFQRGMRTALDLEFQLDEIDYAAANLVHADLSPAELRTTMAERDESLYVYFWRAFYASMRQVRQDPLGLQDLGLLSSVLFARDDTSLKTAIARELTRVDDVGRMLDGDEGSAIIAARNQRAIDVLREQIAAGATRIAIFYGVAHMPDLERQLVEQLGMRPVATRWVDAWRLRDDPPAMLDQGR